MPKLLLNHSLGVLKLLDHVHTGLTLLGQLVLDLGYVVRHPDRFPWRELSATICSAGARALSITALVGLLIGLVISYLSALQLETCGAQGYIVDVLGITVIRELGPMLAAILVAGRSGSAPQMDFVFTVCDNAAAEVCPVWLGQPMGCEMFKLLLNHS